MKYFVHVFMVYLFGFFIFTNTLVLLYGTSPVWATIAMVCAVFSFFYYICRINATILEEDKVHNACDVMSTFIKIILTPLTLIFGWPMVLFEWFCDECSDVPSAWLFFAAVFGEMIWLVSLVAAPFALLGVL